MKVAFLSDVHGNEIALEACLSATQRLGIDGIHFLGDAVGYLPGEVPVLARLADAGIPCQQGNHEAMLLAERLPDASRDSVYRLAAVRARLRNTTAWERIRTWPTRRTWSLSNRRFLLVHGSPSDELFGYVHQDTDLASFEGELADVIVMANTHRPWVREQSGVVFVNTGSVGLPRDHGALAAFAVYDADANRFSIVRVPIDVQMIGRRYGGEIAPEVAQCFSRRTEHWFGQILV